MARKRVRVFFPERRPPPPPRPVPVYAGLQPVGEFWQEPLGRWGAEHYPSGKSWTRLSSRERAAERAGAH